MSAAPEPGDVVDAFLVKRTPEEMAARDAERHAAEVARGRTPKIGDRLRDRPGSLEYDATKGNPHTVVHVSDGGVDFWPRRWTERTWIARHLDYLDEPATPDEIVVARQAWEAYTGQKLPPR